MLETIDVDPWGKPYKLVTRKLQGPSATANMDHEDVLRITDTLFPSRLPADAQMLPAELEFPPFTVEEVDKAVHRAQRKSTAPGLDCITGRILRVVHQLRPTMLIGPNLTSASGMVLYQLAGKEG
ncbi:unnamed protein product [Macrosiphum euphorbiae]|uniref:Uncharacterized protein n=1 Tax=Macrosiphum euphorbiae TaxID=13131 RepID=A0AAV0WP22_9HEMI|nr:unnamed protein product [Macrosiphum euphorbiae]